MNLLDVFWTKITHSFFIRQSTYKEKIPGRNQNQNTYKKANLKSKLKLKQTTNKYQIKSQNNLSKKIWSQNLQSWSLKWRNLQNEKKTQSQSWSPTKKQKKLQDQWAWIYKLVKKWKSLLSKWGIRTLLISTILLSCWPF